MRSLPALLLPLLTACPTPDDSATDTQPAVDVCAEQGLPSSHDQVQAAYDAAEAEAVEQGDAVMALFHAGDIDAVWELCTADVQALITKDDLQAIYEQIFAVEPVDDLVDRRSLATGRSMYDISSWDWLGITLAISWAFDDDGQLAGLGIQQASELPDPNPDYDSAVAFELPFDCLVYTAWGGRDELHNYHTAYAQGAYAYDFLIWHDGGTCAEPCEDNEDYYIFGQPLYAPAAGTVVEVEDVHPDMPPGEMDPVALEGNHVTLEVAEGEYLLLAHMQSGSVQVAVGDVVEQGQHIGDVGNSGNTTEAHLHIHLQDQVSYTASALSMPQDFYGIVVDGSATERGMPVGGQFVVRAD